MTFDPTDNYGDGKVLLNVEGEYAGFEVQAFCSPDSEGQVYFSDGELVGDVGFINRNGAPFDFDAVLVEDVYPQEGEIDELAEALGPAFDDEFTGKVDAVFDAISGSDDPLDTIKNLDPNDVK